MTDFLKQYGPWAVVTGASSGIGAEFSRQLAGKGFNLVLVARRQERLEALAREIVSRSGIEAKTVAADLSSPDFLSAILVQTRGLDVGLLVNNAGYAMTGGFLDHSPDREAAMLSVNCRALVMMTHAFGSPMKQRGTGGIINVASVAAFFPMPLWSHYAATKAFVLSFSQGIWHELKPYGVDVLALCPGATRTEFSEVAGTKLSGMKAGPVVTAALHGLGGRPVVVPGWRNRFLAGFSRLLPGKALIFFGAKAVENMIDRKQARGI
jgi:hypothetical protein